MKKEQLNESQSGQAKSAPKFQRNSSSSKKQLRLCIFRTGWFKQGFIWTPKQVLTFRAHAGSISQAQTLVRRHCLMYLCERARRKVLINHRSLYSQKFIKFSIHLKTSAITQTSAQIISEFCCRWCYEVALSCFALACK
jgi:hypothetical protein